MLLVFGAARADIAPIRLVLLELSEVAGVRRKTDLLQTNLAELLLLRLLN